MLFDNERKIKSENEKAEHEIEITSALYGYAGHESAFFETKAYEKLLMEFLKSKQSRIYNFGLPALPIKLIRENANKFLVSKTEGIDRRVLYLPNDESILYEFALNHGELDTSNYDEFIKFIKRKALKKDVINLPIRWRLNDSRNGTAHVCAIHLDDIEFIKKVPIISTGITLINQNDILGSTALVHEMTHALIDKHKGIVRNNLHAELLTIYMELLAAYEIDTSGQLLDITILNRLQSLKNNILENYLNQYNGHNTIGQKVYIISSLYAFNLFETYKGASDSLRKSITIEINQTLSGNRQLEDTIEVIGANEEKGSEMIRKHIKRLMK
ncbi:MAG: hypothetical protein IJ093_04450 [Bacilli bacterium]|nr:hypothetical protein [Bacilli bacterium]